MRVRSRTPLRRRGEWPLSVTDELRAGVDLDDYPGRLSGFFARWAGRAWASGDHVRAVDDLTFARELEDLP
jgi:hypothetical protein